MNLVIKDKLSFADNKSNHIPMPSIQSHGLWAKTEIFGSNDDIAYDKDGIFSHFVKKIPVGVSTLGETIFRTEKTEPKWKRSNMVPLGGCQFAMEQLFGVKGPIDVSTLHEMSGIGKEDAESITSSYDVPDDAGKATKSNIYNVGNFVQLFGIGITSTSENDVLVPDVNYREKSIEFNNGNKTGEMVPFRYTVETLNAADRVQYFGKKTDESGVTAYYLKKFDREPQIKHVTRTGEDIETETALVNSPDIWNISSTDAAIESFTECILTITKDDVKEWFTHLNQEDKSRINTIALFTGQYVKNADGSIGDYRDIRMFSKLTIPVEYLSLTKNLNLVYRVYTA